MNQEKEQKFKKKVQELLARKNLNTDMIEKGLAGFDFLIVGMTMESDNVFLTSGIHCFVANGYPPAGLHFPGRDSANNVRFVCTEVYAVKREGDIFHFQYLFNDRDCLNPQKILPVLKKIARERGWMPWQNRLAKIRMYETSNFELMLVLFTYQGGCVVCSLDSGRISIVEDKSLIYIEESIPNISGKTCRSDFSCYRFKEDHTLERDEWNRNGGIDCFIS